MVQRCLLVLLCTYNIAIGAMLSLWFITSYACNSRPGGCNAFCALRSLHFAEHSNMVNNSALNAYVTPEELE